MTQTKTNKKNFINQLKECLEEKSMVEVLTDTNEVTGTLTVIGDDYLGISSGRERTATSIAVGQDGREEEQKYIEVFHMETFVKFKDIRAVSRVLKKTTK